jgi:hypothetical protein
MNSTVISVKKKRNPTIEVELRRLAAEGDLTPRRVVQEARDPESPLHNEFDFSDVQGAAQLWWEQQARVLIERYRVYVYPVRGKGEPTRVPVFVRNPDAAAREQGYVSVADMDEDQASRALTQELERIESHITRGWALAQQWGLQRKFRTAMRRVVEQL